MQWLNLNIATLDCEAFVFSTPVEQSVWLNMQRYCIGQENGGVITGARTWTNRQWQQVVRVDRKDVLRESRLWEWQADDLRVKFYPHDSQLEVEAKRRGATQRHSKRPAEHDAQHDAEHGAEHDAEQVAERTGKEREGKEREKKEKESGALPRNFHLSEADIPTSEQCLQWGREAGVPEDWIRAKHTVTTGTHGWVRNGQLIQWQTLWRAWFEEDRVKGRWPKKPAQPTGGDWPVEWDAYDAEKVRGIATGAAASGEATTLKKCRAWLAAHHEL